MIAASDCLNPRRLHLVIMPTEQCNLRCSYCWEDFELGEMTPAVVRSVKTFIDTRLRELDLLSIEWFGGEPLAGWEPLRAIQEHAFSRCRDQGVGLQATMTTNATLLTVSRLEFLVSRGVRSFQISLDGDKELHDRTRATRSGRGTFDRIWHNLVASKTSAAQFQIKIRLHLLRDNLQSTERLLRRISREFSGDPRFSVLIKGIRHTGGPFEKPLELLSRTEVTEQVGRMAELAARLGLVAVDKPLEDPQTVDACYASAPNSLVIRSDGCLAKCTVALRHENNAVGRLQPDGTVELDSSKMTGWARGVLAGDATIMRCPMTGWADSRTARVAPSPRPLPSRRNRGLTVLGTRSR